MACPWDIDYRGEPDPERQAVECRCRECGAVEWLPCDRDFTTGILVVQVHTCARKRTVEREGRP